MGTISCTASALGDGTVPPSLLPKSFQNPTHESGPVGSKPATERSQKRDPKKKRDGPRGPEEHLRSSHRLGPGVLLGSSQARVRPQLRF